MPLADFSVNDKNVGRWYIPAEALANCPQALDFVDISVRFDPELVKAGWIGGSAEVWHPLNDVRTTVASAEKWTLWKMEALKGWEHHMKIAIEVTRFGKRRVEGCKSPLQHTTAWKCWLVMDRLIQTCMAGSGVFSATCLDTSTNQACEQATL